MDIVAVNVSVTDPLFQLVFNRLNPGPERVRQLRVESPVPQGIGERTDQAQGLLQQIAEVQMEPAPRRLESVHRSVESRHSTSIAERVLLRIF